MKLEDVKRGIEEMRKIADEETDDLRENILIDSGIYEQEFLIKLLEDTQAELEKYI